MRITHVEQNESALDLIADMLANGTSVAKDQAAIGRRMSKKSISSICGGYKLFLAGQLVTTIGNKVGRIQHAATKQHFHNPCIRLDGLRRIFTQQ
jgi:hypothetical protein